MITTHDVRTVPVTKLFFWPHPYARPYLWRRVTLRYRYFIGEQEVDISGSMLPPFDGAKMTLTTATSAIPPQDVPPRQPKANVEWREVFAIVLSVVSFAVLAYKVGFLAATAVAALIYGVQLYRDAINDYD